MFVSIFKADAPRIPQIIERAPETPRPNLPASRLVKSPVHAQHEEQLAEYAALAATLGLEPPHLHIETFKAVLKKLDFPIFALPEVVAYMDEKAEKESKHKAGWEWKPLRAKDHREVSFGRACQRPDGNYAPARLGIPASDYYAGLSETSSQRWVDNAPTAEDRQVRMLQTAEAQQIERKRTAYNHTIPLHAMRRVAAIEREFTGDVAFFVSDYALLPAVLYPDPFLMAVIPNPNLSRGEGRFVIDFWDEPGFGIEQMLK